jgi:hypothetical protein
MTTKLSSSEQIDVMNADSLNEYCRTGHNYNVAKKNWVQVLYQIVDRDKKTCRFVIK